MLILEGKRHLDAAEEIEVATRMQYAAVEAVFRARAWTLEDVVFHGGTSLKIAWDSLRRSEDLDFMIAERSVGHLHKLMRAVHSMIDARLGGEVPGSTVTMKDHESHGRIHRFDFRWSHPARLGKVMTKVELYAVPLESLVSYARTLMVPSMNRDTRATIKTQISVSQIESVMADKLVAIAMRPYQKHRDLYDLWYVDDVLSRQHRAIDPVIDLEAVSHVASIYGNGIGEISQGLAGRLSDGYLEDVEGFTKKMAKWMPDDIHEMLKRNGSYGAMLERDRMIISHAIATLEERPEAGAMRP